MREEGGRDEGGMTEREREGCEGEKAVNHSSTLSTSILTQGV